MDYNDETEMRKKLIKRDFNKLGLTILMNELIANVVIFICVVIIFVGKILVNPNISQDGMLDVLKDGRYSGTLSIIGVVIAFIPFLIYRGKTFFQHDLRVENKKFNLKTVLVSAVVLLSLNSFLGIFASLLESLLNLFGLSANFALEQLESLNDFAIPMLIYTCLVAPIFEEFIYRGAILRSLEKYGKKFAIMVSALLFGMMHGNFYQIFMAMGVGLILGYLATEYSIKLTIILHIINNVSVQALTILSPKLGDNIGNIFDISFLVIAIIILIAAIIKKRKSVKEGLLNNSLEKGLMTKFFTSILIVLVLLIDIFEVISGIGKL
ncbi:type II CAAX endopeptidase family protein [Clostridium sp. YIM B02555]|uniref:CPBP family intramembrane glutamic endopeptidase n=1 Tax=Clostridium sp. YIM B02555 TaxID=2911968 RepID=UPI001EED9A44|nr:type II CAAX endopeptidase family protein [Clostridium sp. YIM B02555]